MPNELRYPNKSHRKPVRLPEESEMLAEFMGIEFGDGGVTNPWQVVISLNSIADKEYVAHVQGLFYTLSSIQPAVRNRKNRNCTVVACSSTDVVDFLVKKGIARGNKVKERIDIPGWIARDKAFCKAFVRGMMDTDGGLYIHKHVCLGHQYSNLGLCFSSHSLPLLHSVHKILVNSGISARIHSSGNKLYVYKTRDIERYLEVFGTSNPRILNVYQKWRDVRVA